MLLTLISAAAGLTGVFFGIAACRGTMRAKDEAARYRRTFLAQCSHLEDLHNGNYPAMHVFFAGKRGNAYTVWSYAAEFGWINPDQNASSHGFVKFPVKDFAFDPAEEGAEDFARREAEELVEKLREN